MTQQHDIENEFLTIEPSDNERLYSFYSKHINYFNSEPPLDMDSHEKYLTMICEIGNSFSFTGRHKEALKILKKAENIFRKVKVNNNSNPGYNSIVFCLGNSNLALNRHYKALKYFKMYIPTENEENKINRALKICKDKLKNKILLLIGILGIIVLVAKYSVKWFLPENYSIFFQYSGFIGGILLLTYGIIGFNLRKKNNP